MLAPDQPDWLSPRICPGGDLTIDKADGKSTTIKSNPRTGDNADLQTVGAAYGVNKLASDPPHWSSDGH